MITESAKPSIALTYATAYSAAPSYGQFGGENIPAASPEPAKRSWIPKSRTLNMLSNISQSISRSSLTSITVKPGGQWDINLLHRHS